MQNEYSKLMQRCFVIAVLNIFVSMAVCLTGCGGKTGNEPAEQTESNAPDRSGYEEATVGELTEAMDGIANGDSYAVNRLVDKYDQRKVIVTGKAADSTKEGFKLKNGDEFRIRCVRSSSDTGKLVGNGDTVEVFGTITKIDGESCIINIDYHEVTE